jgi:hypothetical protein
MSQTLNEYALTSQAAQPGQKYSSQYDHVISRAAESVVLPGQALGPGTDPAKQCEPFDGGQFIGIALLDYARENAYLSDDGVSYAETDPVSILRKGACYVEVAVEVEAFETAYVTDAGLYTNVSTENTEIGQFVTSAEAEGLAAVEINLP